MMTSRQRPKVLFWQPAQQLPKVRTMDFGGFQPRDEELTMNPSLLNRVQTKDKTMRPQYKAQWVSKRRCDALRRTPATDILLLGMSGGFIVVEPASKTFGDGPVLSREECDYELRPAWYYGPMARLTEARERLGLAGGFSTTA
jgi:hypothetical protein